MNKWISVKDRLPEPGVKVIAYFLNEFGKHRRIMAMYAPPKTVEAETDDEWCDYDEKTDNYYIPCGWYEHNEFDETHWGIDNNITHWMPLPKPPGE
jgi:hypothetical protein